MHEAAQSDRAKARSAALGVAARASARPSAPHSASSRVRRGPSCPPCCSATPRGRVRSVRRALCSEVREVRLTCLWSRHLPLVVTHLPSSRHTSLSSRHLSLVATHLSLVATHLSEEAACNFTGPVQVRVESATFEDHIDCFGGSHLRHVITFC